MAAASSTIEGAVTAVAAIPSTIEGAVADVAATLSTIEVVSTFCGLSGSSSLLKIRPRWEWQSDVRSGVWSYSLASGTSTLRIRSRFQPTRVVVPSEQS